jgi:hypothetical protein
MLATWGTIILKPRKMLHSSTTGFANNNSKVMGGTTKIAPKVIPLFTQALVLPSLRLKILFLVRPR